MDDIVFLLNPEGMVRLLADRLRKNFRMPGQCPVRSHKMQAATGRKCVAVLGAFLWRNLLENWPTPSQIELLKEILICFPVSLACVFCAAIGLSSKHARHRLWFGRFRVLQRSQAWRRLRVCA